MNKRSDTSFLVQLSDDLVIRCHPDQLRHRSVDVPDALEAATDRPDDMLTWPDPSSDEDSTPHSSASTQRTAVRHSTRPRRPPDRFLPDI